MNNLLVTGLSGLVGTAFRETWGDQYQLTGLNRSEVPGVETVRASLDNYEAIRGAFEGQDCVIHLAAKISDDYGWADLHDTNVVGTRNVLEAAVDAGVKRVVFTSSGATVAGWELLAPFQQIVEGQYDKLPENWTMIDETMATRPRNLYASTKVWGEALARHYADNHNLEVICLRIGYASGEDKPLNPRQYSVWNSQRDVVQALKLSLDCDLQDRCETCFILSDNHWSYRNIDRARELLGYEPQDKAEDYRV